MECAEQVVFLQIGMRPGYMAGKHTAQAEVAATHTEVLAELLITVIVNMTHGLLFHIGVVHLNSLL